jgi:hypothetical protein
MLVAVIGESFPRRLSSMISWRKVPQEMLRRRGRSDSQTRIRRPAPGAHHAGERMSLGYPSPIQQSGGSSRAEQQALALSAEGASMTVRPPRWLVSFAGRNARDSVATEPELQVGNSRPGAIDDPGPL